MVHVYKWSCSCRHTGGARGPAKGRQREREIELEAVIENLKRVIEKQQAEAEHLRKTGTTNAKYQPTCFCRGGVTGRYRVFPFCPYLHI